MRFRHCASALLISVGFVVGILVLGGTVAAQTARRNQPPLTQATRAYLDGRYDEVSALTASLSQSDPAVVALKARALIARGKYADAETLLKPAAAQQPASVAALELGLLGQKLGRSDANATRPLHQPRQPTLCRHDRRSQGNAPGDVQGGRSL